MKAEEFIFEDDIPEMIDGKPTRNSNGKYIHSTIEGIRNFWKWFGDSKVVDAQGRPLVVYHGTNYSTLETNRGLLFFTANKEAASSYANKDSEEFYNGQMYPAYLRISQLATRDNVINEAKLLNLIDQDDNEWFGFDLIDQHEELVDALHKKYDGIFFDIDYPYDDPFTEITSYCIFNIKNVKSALGNKGTFSPSSNNITESVNIPDMIDGKPTRNSEGKPIHHSEDGIRNFWKWFGDSRTVDSQGRPLTFYHATNNDFEGFDLSKGYGIAGQGVYLTNNRPTDDKYGTFVMPLYAKMTKRIDFSEGDSKINELALKFNMQALYDLNSFEEIKKWSKQLRDNLVTHGFDSAIIKGEGLEQKYYVVYHPENVKSAIGNKGGYSAKSSNIIENINQDTIWYHASDVADIIDFDDTKLKNEKFGHFFTDDPETVKGIYGSHVYSRKIEVTNPYTISQDKWNSIREAHHGDSGYFKQLRDNIVSKGHDALLVKTRNIQFGRFDIREPNILVVFDASKIKPITSKITEALESTLDDQLKRYKKELEYMNTKGKLPRTAPPNYTNDKRYEYYYYVEDKIKELTDLIQARDEQRATHTPNKLFNNPKFKTWFKGSKVVDDMGDPLPVYHGSNADIQEFNHTFNASSSGNAQYGAGFYFTTNPDVASGYANIGKNAPVVYKVFLSIKKPLSSSKKYKLSRDQIKKFIVGAPNWEETLNDFEDIESYGLAKCLSEAITNLYDYQDETLLETLFLINNDWYRNHDQDFVTKVTEILGYDGIQVNLKDTTHWIAFFPWQVKSALGNKGTYSKKLGNITESLADTSDPRLTRAEELGYDTSKVWWHGSFSKFTEFDPKRSGSSSFHFSSERDFAEDYAHTKATDTGSDDDVYVREFYLPKNLFDFRNQDHIQQLEKILPKEISIQGRYGWAAWGGSSVVPKDELIELIQGIQYPYTGIEDSQKDKIRNGAEYFSREGSNERVINYDAVNDVVEWVPGWEYQDIEGLKNNIKWAIQNFGEDDFRVRQYEIQLKNKQEKLKTRKTELSPQKREGFDNWHLMEAPELKPYFKKLGFEGALMQERKKLNVAIFDSNRIRSVNAEFNPKFKNSSDIMA